MLKLSAIAAAAFLTAVVVRADPAVWTPNPHLHQAFWGIAYTSQDSSYYPQCGDTIAEVVGDVQLMAQITSRIRLYGTDCEQFSLVQQAIQQTQTNLHVFPGIYIDGNDTTYTRQRDQLFQVLDQYGLDNILGITVGNEYLLGAYTADPNSLATAQTYLLSKISDVRTVLASKNYNKTIPVGSADAGSQVTATYAAACDYVMANTHPFFSGVTIEGAAQWTAEYLIDQEPSYATQAGKTLYSAEIGWPTDAIPGDLTANGSIASIGNTQILLDTFVCAANTNISAGGPYDHGFFWFELFDQEWKVPDGGGEPFWGLFDQYRNLKNLTIPTCLASIQPPVGNMGSNTGGGGGTGTTTVNSTSGGGSGGHSGGASSTSPSYLMLSIGAISMLLAAAGGGFALL